MSKKNKKSTKRNRRAFDLENEKAAQEQKVKKLEKKQQSAGVQKVKKAKTFRIRKGVRVGGIVVKDAETKKKARKLLAARAALKMDVDATDAAPKATKKVKVGGGIKIAKASSKSASKAAAGASTMDTD